jgi:autotransporter-associated beta strand protein
LIIGGTNHLNDGTLTGSSQINAGTLIITNGGVVSLSFAQFYVAQGVGSTSSVVVAGGTLAALNNFIVVGRGDVTANGTLTVNGGTVQKAGANQLVIGSLGATGRLIVNGGQVLNNGDLWLGEGPSGNGTLFLNGGLVQADVIRPNNNGGLPTNSTASTANFNGGTLQATGSSPDFLQSTALILTNGLILDDGGFTIDISSHALLSGSTPDGGLVKKGAGTVYLDATNSYSGTTQVTSGMLAGIGSLNGPVLVVPTGNLGAGNTNGPGTLTLNSAPLTLRGLATMRVSKTGGILTNDLITGVSAVSYGGTLVISNATSDGTLLAANDQFTLFSAATPSGSFGGIAGSPGAGLAYRFNSATGVLSVITAPAIAPNPTNLTFNVTGSTLKLNWPPDHEGWILQEQTNGLTTGITTNWFDVEGTANVTNTSIIISPANPTVFFRLRHP